MLVVGICSFTMYLHEGTSLKEKRMILKSLTQRIKSRYNVSIAEIGAQEKWQRSEIGISCVSNSRIHVEKTLQEVLRFAEADGRAEIMNIEKEII
jgi:uncharacterized protein